VRYDARGHGASSGDAEDPMNPFQYTWPELGSDLLALADDLNKQFDGESGAPIDVIGTSMGTGTILHATAQNPERFRRLVLSAPPVAWEMRAPLSAMFEGMAALVEQEGAEAVAAAMSKAPIPPVFSTLPDYPPQLSGELLPTLFLAAARSDLPAKADLAAVRAPTLILAWTGDPGHPISVAEQLADTLPSAELIIAETPEQLHTWGQLVVDFLGD